MTTRKQIHLSKRDKEQEKTKQGLTISVVSRSPSPRSRSRSRSHSRSPSPVAVAVSRPRPRPRPHPHPHARPSSTSSGPTRHGAANRDSASPSRSPSPPPPPPRPNKRLPPRPSTSPSRSPPPPKRPSPIRKGRGHVASSPSPILSPPPRRSSPPRRRSRSRSRSRSLVRRRSPSPRRRRAPSRSISRSRTRTRPRSPSRSRSRSRTRHTNGKKTDVDAKEASVPSPVLHPRSRSPIKKSIPSPTRRASSPSPSPPTSRISPSRPSPSHKSPSPPPKRRVGRGHERETSRERDLKRRMKRSRSRSRSTSGSRRRDRDRRRSSRSPSRSRSRSRPRPRSRSRSSRTGKFDVTAISNTLAAVQKLTQAGLAATVNGQFVASSTASTAAAIQAATNDTALAQLLQTTLAAQNPALTRQARRLYVGNLPVGMLGMEQALQQFFNVAVVQVGITTPNPILSVWVSTQGTFAFVEFRSVLDCSLCLTLLQNINFYNRNLNIGRPQDYKPPPPGLETFVVGQAAGTPLSMPNMPAAGLIPPHLLAHFANPGTILPVDDEKIPASSMMDGVTETSTSTSTETSTSTSTSASQIPSTPTSRTLCLMNMVEASELEANDEFEETVLDIREECEKFGKVEKIVIPRPIKDGIVSTAEGPTSATGVGRIFVQYDTPTSAAKALASIHGRNFNARKIQVQYYPDDKIEAGQYV